jgi:putative endonuclease
MSKIHYWIYIVQCRDKSLYTGIAVDFKKRFKEHQNKKGGHYTASHPVKKIVYTEKLQTRGQALKREALIKSLTRKKKLRLINSERKINSEN